MRKLLFFFLLASILVLTSCKGADEESLAESEDMTMEDIQASRGDTYDYKWEPSFGDKLGLSENGLEIKKEITEHVGTVLNNAELISLNGNFDSDEITLDIKIDNLESYYTGQALDGIYLNITSALAELQELGYPLETVNFEVMYPIEDVKPERVVKAKFTGETIEDIDFLEFSYENIPNVAVEWEKNPEIDDM